MRGKQNLPGAVEKIKAALLRLMEEKSYCDITVSEISREAGLSRQAFYLYFRDKDDILRIQFEGFFDTIIKSIRSNRVGTVDELVSLYTSIVEDNARYLRLLAANNLGAFLGDVFVAGFAELPPVLPTQKNSGNKNEYRYILAFWVHAFIQVYTLWISDDMQTSSDEIKRILTDIMKGNYFSEKSSE